MRLLLAFACSLLYRYLFESQSSFLVVALEGWHRMIFLSNRLRIHYVNHLIVILQELQIKVGRSPFALKNRLGSFTCFIRFVRNTELHRDNSKQLWEEQIRKFSAIPIRRFRRIYVPGN